MVIVLNDQQRYEVEQSIIKGEFKGCLLKNADYHKMITFTLVKNNIPFHRVNYGAGVIKLLLNENVCIHCKGKG